MGEKKRTMSENTAATSFVSSTIKDFNDWADTLTKRANDKDAQGVIEQLNHISKSVNNDKDLIYPKGIEEEDGKKIAESYDDVWNSFVSCSLSFLLFLVLYLFPAASFFSLLKIITESC